MFPQAGATRLAVSRALFQVGVLLIQVMFITDLKKMAGFETITTLN